jgi:methanogenic corrinoid protein MtbC1
VTVEENIHKEKTDQIRELLISALMLNAALHIKDVVTGLKAEGLDVKVVVGGAPFLFDSDLWREVHADAMGHSAGDAPGIIQEIMGGWTR